MRNRFPCLVALFFVSGAAALLYEVLWVRQLMLVFGNTVHASAAVLTAYMGGLALGSWWFGRWMERRGASFNPWRLYGVMEIAIGAISLLFPWYLHMILPLQRHLYQDAAPLWVQTPVRFLATLAFLLIPTALMGGTLPVLTRLAGAAGAERTRKVSLLYGFNTIGATLGVVACGFFLLPSLGVKGTYAVAVAANVLLGIAALALARPAGEPAGPAPAVAGGHSTGLTMFLAAYMVSGFVSLALEVTWTRVLLMVFGSTVYSFTTMLAVYLAGIGAGGAVLGAMVRKIESPSRWLAGMFLAMAAWLAIAHGLLNHLPLWFLSWLYAHGATWHAYLGGKILLASLILFPQAFLFGAMFPLVARVGLTHGGGSAAVGRIYALNTVGSILGSAIAGFVLIPWLGTETTMQALTSLLAVVAIALLLRAGSAAAPVTGVWKAGGIALAVLSIAGVIGSGRWDKKVLAAGVYFRPGEYVNSDGQIILQEKLRNYQVKEYIEGLTETAIVIQTPLDRMFLVDGKVEATTNLIDMRLQRLMGHLPMLFAKERKDAVNIGLGCGVTLGALSPYPDLERLEVIEIERNITRTARWFAEENHHVLDNPKLRVTITDGRNHMLLTDRSYDVITSDPFEPLVGGAATLYSYDHFVATGRRLKPGGVACQYLPLYQLSPSDFRMIVRSFAEAYPHAVIFYTGIDSIMLGSFDPIEISYSELERRMSEPAVKASLAGVGMEDPARLLATFMFDLKKHPEYYQGLPLNSDAHPHIEFSAPKSHLQQTTPRNVEGFLEFMRPEEVPVTLTDPGQKERFLKLCANHRVVMQALIHNQDGRPDEALPLLRQALAVDPDDRMAQHELTVAASRIAESLRRQGKFVEALPLYREAFLAASDKAMLALGMAACYHGMGQVDEAYMILAHVALDSPDLPEGHLRAGQVALELGQYQRALEHLGRAWELEPGSAEIALSYCESLLHAGTPGPALEIYAGVEESRYQGVDFYYRGEARANAGDLAGAAQDYRRSLDLAPGNASARAQLVRVLAKSGRAEEAARERQILEAGVGREEAARLLGEVSGP